MEELRPTPEKKPRRWLRRLVTIMVAAVVLIILLVGAAVAYVYFGQAKPLAVQSMPAAPKPQTILPKQKQTIPDDTAVGASIQTITSPVTPGDNSYMAIRTLQTATCSIDIEYNKVKATDSGLVPKVADEYGTVSWSWTVPGTVPLGSWPVNVTCTHGSKSAVVTATLVVTATKDT